MESLSLNLSCDSYCVDRDVEQITLTIDWRLVIRQWCIVIGIKIDETQTMPAKAVGNNVQNQWLSDRMPTAWIKTVTVAQCSITWPTVSVLVTVIDCCIDLQLIPARCKSYWRYSITKEGNRQTMFHVVQLHLRSMKKMPNRCNFFVSGKSQLCIENIKCTNQGKVISWDEILNRFKPFWSVHLFCQIQG